MNEFEHLYSASARFNLGMNNPLEDEPNTHYNFNLGTPDPTLYPEAELKSYLGLAIETYGPACFEYYERGGFSEMSYGYIGLREQIAARMAARHGATIPVTGVLLANGSVAAIGLACHAYLQPGDGVVVEATSFPYGLRYMRNAGAEVVAVPVDDAGMVVEQIPSRLEEFRSRGITPKIIYTVATHNIPTGTVMSLERRHMLLDIANEWDLIILEDNVYYEFYYDDHPPATLLSLDTSDRVIQTDSFSKKLAPGLGVGWAVGSEEAIWPLAAMREDYSARALVTHALELFLADNRLDPQLDLARKVYGAKRAVAAEALDEACGGLVKYRLPDGGFYFWLELSEELNAEKVRKLALERGINCRAGERYTGDPSGGRFLRMAFTLLPEDDIAEGIRLFGDVLRQSRA